MQRLAIATAFLAVLACSRADTGPETVASEAASPPAGAAQPLRIVRKGSSPSSPGPDQYFTGSARVDPLFAAEAPSRMAAAYVTFEPGARSAWHTHPVGQTLIVTDGSGRVQRWGGPVQDIHPGDVVRIPANEKHWHGASPITALTHIAIQEQVDGKTVDWLEKVSDAQYLHQP